MNPIKILFPAGAAILFFFVLNALPLLAAGSQDRLQQSLNQVLENSPVTTLGYTELQGIPSEIDQILLSLYVKNNSQPYWVTRNGPTQKAAALLSVLNIAAGDGLNPDDYRLIDIHNLWRSRKPEDLARLDVMLTMAMGAYVTDMREGRAVTCLLDPKLFAAARDQKVDIIEVIQQGLSAPDLVQFLQQQAPQHHGYQSLKKALAHYRILRSRNGWPVIPAGQVLKPGMQDNRLDLLIRRLSITGDLQQPLSKAGTYDGRLVEAVKHFQKRYNLEQDGIIGKKTMAALNIPVQDHIRRIIINMERWRWLPHSLDGQRVLVNIAGFHLAGTLNEKPEISMPVIVGKQHHETPVFSHTMRYIEFNPYWNIPNSIAENEMIPKMIKNPGYLKKERIRIFDGWQENAPEVNPVTIDWQTIGKGIKRYRLRQDSGPDNALGTIKFMFPNSYNVYMHDTPAHSLFKRNNRSFSHGCIRVSRPRDLALHILDRDDHGWSKERIDALIKKGKRTVVLLKKPFPVHILYRTVFVDSKDNTVHFYDDVYGRDTLLAQALFTGNQPVQCRY
ncbi:MAG: L,D-transpeptidase family protein [Thermodesulfobacteriota bacterium]|nr:L,D-transpeptidase family protein [Thermodesulfobacteriota bacterium]